MHGPRCQPVFRFAAPDRRAGERGLRSLCFVLAQIGDEVQRRRTVRLPLCGDDVVFLARVRAAVAVCMWGYMAATKREEFAHVLKPGRMRLALQIVPSENR